MKEIRYFNYQERDYIAYDYLIKEKIGAISEGVSEGSVSQRKE